MSVVSESVGADLPRCPGCKLHLGVVRDQMSPAVRANPEAYPEIDYFRRTPEYHRGGFEDWFAFELNDAPFNLAYYQGREVNPRRQPGYQTDVLTGMVGALLAQGHDAATALRAAVYLHGAAADDLVRMGTGPVGLTASEVIRAARERINRKGCS